MTTLRAADGHELYAYSAIPKGNTLGGLVIIHEIFGVTDQMKALADHFAGAGYHAIVPALYDRINANTVISYEDADQGKELAGTCNLDQVLLDVQAAIDNLSEAGPISVVGYCWGGGLAYLATCKLNLCCGASFYGTRLPSYLPETPSCPFQFHFGGQDQAVPADVVEAVREANPSAEIFIYEDAGHAFTNNLRPNFHATSTELAEKRLFEFMQKCRQQ